MPPALRPHASILLSTTLHVVVACAPDASAPAPPETVAAPPATNNVATAPGSLTSEPQTTHANATGTSAAAPSRPELTSPSAPSTTSPQSFTSDPPEPSTGALSAESSAPAATDDSSAAHAVSSAGMEAVPLATSDEAASSNEAAAVPLQPPAEPVTFGTTLDAAAVMTAARDLARSLTDEAAPTWRTKGDQHRSYRFPETNKDEPYRLYVPTTWDGHTKLPLVMFLHGSGSNENTYVDQNDQQMIALAEQHEALLVAPLGAGGAYGNFLRLSAPFGNPKAASELMAQVTPESRRSNELSEMDVINVLELVLAEYPVDYSSMFLTGHSMGSGGTWYIGGKYSTYWRAIAPMSGPFVQEDGYPWSNVRDIGIFVTEGTQTPSLDGSRLLDAWLSQQAFDTEYKEVDADHGGMVRLVLPDVFTFFANRRPH